jgi:pimeloyl-ACP methyl ester carboxylesterase
MPTAQLDDTSLEYTDRGAGEPVVLVHGSLGDLRSWEPQVESLAEDHRVIAYSRRYHHPNPCPPDGPYSASLHADDLADLMSELDVPVAHVVGSSYGAYTALFLAMRHPDRVCTQVLSEPPVLPLLADHPDGHDIRDRFLADVWRPAGEVLEDDGMERGVRTFVDGLFGDGAFDSLPHEVLQLIMDNAPAFKLETATEEFWTPFARDDAAQVETPTLLVSGGSSLRMFQLIVDELESCLPHSEQVRFPDTSHDVPAEQATAFNELVARFIDSHRC